jgi:hypothetical protein
MAFGSKDQSGFWPRWTENRLFTVLLGILFAYLIVFFAFLIKNEAKKNFSIGKAPEERRTLTVNGMGKEVGAPDIATVDLGFTTQSTDVQTALRLNNEKMTRLTDGLQKVGVAAADMQTNRFNVYPNYDYNHNPYVITGYTADQGLTVKVRDLAKVNDVLRVAGDVGTNNVSNLNFTIDDPRMLQDAAREKAITDAHDQAKILQTQLGVRFVRLVNFSESGNTPQPPIYYAKEGLGAGGGGAPDTQPGSLEITSNVSLTYEID